MYKIVINDGEGEKNYYSEDVVDKVRLLTDALLDAYPECSQFCMSIYEVLDGKM